jgi:hypothetical protein
VVFEWFNVSECFVAQWQTSHTGRCVVLHFSALRKRGGHDLAVGFVRDGVPLGGMVDKRSCSHVFWLFCATKPFYSNTKPRARFRSMARTSSSDKFELSQTANPCRVVVMDGIASHCFYP